MKFTKLLVVTFFAFLFFCACSYGQNIDKISSRCRSPYQSTYGNILVTGNGDITYTPCATRSSIFYGNVDFTNATIIGGTGVTGSGTVNFIPRWSATTALTNTPFSWNNTAYNWNNTALNATFAMNFVPTLTETGSFIVGRQSGGTNTNNYLSLNQNTGVSVLQGGGGGQARLNADVELDATPATGNIFLYAGAPSTSVFEINGTDGELNYQGIVSGSSQGTLLSLNGNVADTYSIGDISGITNGTYFQVDNGNEKFSLLNGNDAATFNLQAIHNFIVQRDVSFSTGNVTIDKPIGAVIFAAASSDLTVTDNVVLGGLNPSLIFCTIQSNDTTATSCRVTDRTTGSFHIRLNAAATADTTVAFWIVNG